MGQKLPSALAQMQTIASHSNQQPEGAEPGVIGAGDERRRGVCSRLSSPTVAAYQVQTTTTTATEEGGPRLLQLLIVLEGCTFMGQKLPSALAQMQTIASHSNSNPKVLNQG
ncbi:hypothetical protein DIPPA_24513 [Diplonema papillatum]|nr:hypothetical protein DIPPA_24527 [Diplonema papillatum]KAJ9449468.1 hypothetical protein DIPPA_24513 [Diplonema papillatum]